MKILILTGVADLIDRLFSRPQSLSLYLRAPNQQYLGITNDDLNEATPLNHTTAIALVFAADAVAEPEDPAAMAN